MIDDRSERDWCCSTCGALNDGQPPWRMALENWEHAPRGRAHGVAQCMAPAELIRDAHNRTLDTRVAASRRGAATRKNRRTP